MKREYFRVSKKEARDMKHIEFGEYGIIIRFSRSVICFWY
jgi:hypothetical protein